MAETESDRDARLIREGYEQLVLSMTSSDFQNKLEMCIQVYIRRGATCYEADLARGYIRTKNALARSSSPDERKDLESILRQYECRLANWYLNNEVSAIFCTLDNSNDERLVANFPAEILVVEQAAHCTFNEIIMPIASYGKVPGSMETKNESTNDIYGTLQLVILVGDDKQETPSTLGTSQNEFNVKIFKQICKAEKNPYSVRPTFPRRVHNLEGFCYMAPELSKYVAGTFYKSGHKSHPMVAQSELPLQTTLRDLHRKRFGRQYNDRPRMILDVSGPDVPSRERKPTKAWINEANIDVIVAYCEELLSHEPPAKTAHLPAGRSIMPKDIMILTFYKGQASKLNSKLLSKESPIRDVRVMAFEQARGTMSNIIIFDLVISIHNKDFPLTADEFVPIEYLEKVDNIRLFMTRARYHLTIVGDIKLYSQCLESKHKYFVKTKNKHLKSLIEDLNRFNDIIPYHVWKNRTSGITRSYTHNTFRDEIIPFRQLNMRVVKQEEPETGHPLEAYDQWRPG